MTIPNLLTLGRIAMLPILLVLVWLPGDGVRWVALAVFCVAAVTDFLDGWLARRLDQQSAFGRMLDPIADKLLVAGLLMGLATADDWPVWGVVAAVVIVLREILLSGLREHLAARAAALAVSRLAKWKTASQMISVALLIVDRGQYGLPLLWVAAILSVMTAWHYVAGLPSLREP